MKCMYNQSKRGLPSDVRTMALKVAKEMLALQVDAVVSRAWNAEPDSGIEEMVNIADRWAKDHPFNTRQSQLLKMFPDARTDDAGILVYCPDAFIAKEISAEYCNKYNKCQECRKDFWLAEVDT